jgi:hypothetical protein
MKLSKLFFIIAVLSFFAFMPGNDCAMYAPAKPGTELEMKNFNANGKSEGTTRIKVIAASKTANGESIEMKSESFDKKDKPTGTASYFLTCENGAFHVDMRTMVPSNQTESFKDMQVTVEADKLDIPAEPTAGQQLKNGSVKMNATTEGSPITMKMAMTVANRKVAAIENITVPAGTFNCVKITYDAEVKNIFTVRMKAAEWYAKNVGLVRSETYNSKDKLDGYSVLNSIK